MSDSATFNMTFSADETFQTEMTQIVEVVTSDHRDLLHRDAEDQHPIEAITNLDTQLQNRVVSGDSLTNEDIESILKF